MTRFPNGDMTSQRHLYRASYNVSFLASVFDVDALSGRSRGSKGAADLSATITGMSLGRWLWGVCRWVVLLAFLGAIPTYAQTSPWVRNDPTRNHGVIVFVHGALGDERSTWTSGTSYWPEMLTHDPTFDGEEVYVYHYPSPGLGPTFSINEIADNMQLALKSDGVLQHDRITFVSHSMGGIVTRAYILRYREVAPKIRMLYFFATPTAGSSYAAIVAIASRNSQFKQLSPMQSDNYLAQLQGDWLAAGFGFKSYCGYEILPLYGQIIVDQVSATHLWTKQEPIDADHITIVKPKDQTSTSYRALKAAFRETALPIPAPPKHAVVKHSAVAPAVSKAPLPVQAGSVTTPDKSGPANLAQAAPATDQASLPSTATPPSTAAQPTPAAQPNPAGNYPQIGFSMTGSPGSVVTDKTCGYPEGTKITDSPNTQVLESDNQRKCPDGTDPKVYIKDLVLAWPGDRSAVGEAADKEIIAFQEWRKAISNHAGSPQLMNEDFDELKKALAEIRVTYSLPTGKSEAYWASEIDYLEQQFMQFASNKGEVLRRLNGTRFDWGDKGTDPKQPPE